jgi:hypothetical protein
MRTPQQKGNMNEKAIVEAQRIAKELDALCLEQSNLEQTFEEANQKLKREIISKRGAVSMLLRMATTTGNPR